MGVWKNRRLAQIPRPMRRHHGNPIGSWHRSGNRAPCEQRTVAWVGECKRAGTQPAKYYSWIEWIRQGLRAGTLRSVQRLPDGPGAWPMLLLICRDGGDC